MSRKTGRSKRLQLYNRGNTACPICLASFTRDAASAGRTVTLEHVPPKSLGGLARCLTCKQCNAGTGRNIDQAAAIAEQPTKVIVDMMGKRGAFTLSQYGKPLTTPFAQFTAQEIWKARTFTFTVPLHDRVAAAASSLKAGYLAVFSLLGPDAGYDYVRGSALQPIREHILDPHRPSDFRIILADNPDKAPDKDILLASQPVPCWLVRIRCRFVVLPHTGDSPTRHPLPTPSGKTMCHTVSVTGSASWSFQSFGALTSLRVHLAGADTMKSLVGLSIRGTLPSGQGAHGVCIRHVGESAILLCAPRNK